MDQIDRVLTGDMKKEDLPFVMCRTASGGAGVHHGYLVGLSGTCVRLVSSHRLWSWVGHNTLNEVANHGAPEGSRISVALEHPSGIILPSVCEVIYVTKKAQESLQRPRWG